ncbi:pyrimidine 5-nucleotidase [Schizopora paradoxa]|uniref:Pyrimidine 5-nucleotidase n=1 Tax=Schizopora paradoxa TaxID=27342 RepID=A0A0H2S217_9AGAM|nr:pyrimidine 5-nucleotidase [Schizopora paradoxa]
MNPSANAGALRREFASLSSSYDDKRAIIWFDIDNTLYSETTKVAEAMCERVDAYFSTLGIQKEEAGKIRRQYRSQYGLVLRGLVRHYRIDTLEYDSRCDGSLPLQTLLKPDAYVRKLLQAIDRSKFRVWALTNAYKTHATRVLEVLDLHDQFEGIVYCDYAEPNFACKPEPAYYASALRRAGIKDTSKCYFIDDSSEYHILYSGSLVAKRPRRGTENNVVAAKQLGWGKCVHFSESKSANVDSETSSSGYHTISSLDQLKDIWPEIFVPSPDGKLGSSLL